MIISKLNECLEFVAGDGTLLRELLHPAKAPLDLRYSLAHAMVKPGLISKPHQMKTSEVNYILQGNGLMTIEHEVKQDSPGEANTIPLGTLRYIKKQVSRIWYFFALSIIHGKSRMKRC